MEQVILEAKGLSKKFEGGYVLKNVDLKIESRQFVVILGHSGSGKSTLLNMMSSILKPTSGHIFYNEKNMTELGKEEISKIRREEIGFIFQHYILLPNLTIEENICLGRSNQKQGISLDTLCSFLGIENLLDKYPYQLSGGEQQRVCIARAVIKKPDILFCDEATGALDSENSKNIIRLLHNFKNTYGTSILFTTHNKEISKTANRVLVLEDGCIVQDTVNQNILSPENMKWEI
jgi:putative ABC transport system ATP-binding protein